MSKCKRYKSNNSIIIYVLMLIFIAIFIFSVIQIIKYIENSKENEKIVEEISKYITINSSEDNEEQDKICIDFNSLKEKNSDTVCYLKVNGTDIESVVVQAKDNSYYLSHNFEKNNNNAGWIFADYRNKFDGTDKNVVIYGHNMKNGTMFSSLKNILNNDWQEVEENKYITFITENKISTYEVFSVYTIENEDYYITTNFKDDEEFQNFIDKIKSRSIKNYEKEVTSKDQILTLSTCCANDNKYRVVLHSKQIN